MKAERSSPRLTEQTEPISARHSTRQVVRRSEYWNPSWQVWLAWTLGCALWVGLGFIVYDAVSAL